MLWMDGTIRQRKKWLKKKKEKKKEFFWRGYINKVIEMDRFRKELCVFFFLRGEE